MKRKFLFLIIIPPLFAGCMTLKEKDYLIENDLQPFLPNMQLTADWQNLRKVIESGHEKVVGGISHSGILKDLVVHNYDSKRKRVPDARIFDALRVYAYELKSNIADTNAPYRGTAFFIVEEFDVKWSKTLAFLSSYTIGVPQLLGVPANIVKSNVSISVVLRDEDQLLIRKYQASGEGLARIGMYWGYGEDGWRKSAVEAFQEAISEISRQARADKLIITKRLSAQDSADTAL